MKTRTLRVKRVHWENWQREQYTGSKLYVAESCLTASLLGSFLTQVCLNPAYQQFEAEYILKKVSQTIINAGSRYVLHFLVVFSFLLLLSLILSSPQPTSFPGLSGAIALVSRLFPLTRIARIGLGPRLFRNIFPIRHTGRLKWELNCD